ncbi:hypothetical protein ALC60_01638 [Trachymyrmex zeteki]|uniref:Uncharacterized protein n=1 Tax=Mycetomoellerius zeteki TaxID=64791 RepID=A0A151XGA8_9HYME|nr:hypothetical protein ALC60_01638 [Trachymyrmex zeteki]
MLPRQFKEATAEFIVSAVMKRITVGSIGKTIVFRGTDRDLVRSLAEIPSFMIYIRYVGVGWS